AVEFEMAPLRYAVHILPDVMIPMMRGSESEGEAAMSTLEPKMKLLADDLSWWTAALAAARAQDEALA
ncbi:MAG TPA: hypothetical protein VL119_08380, partial [Acidimicrobiia bacterium]|nr:hypothetical protein [Acidimicrobiia bacterium]